MAGGVDKIELILFAATRNIGHTNGVELDRDTTLPFEFIVI